MGSKDDIYINKIIISILLCLWGLFIIISNNIDIRQTILERIDGTQQARSIISASDCFLDTLRNNKVFKNIVSVSKYEFEYIRLYLILSITLQNFISKVYDLYLYHKVSNLFDNINKILKIVDCITNFFLVFISNRILVIIFDILANNQPVIDITISRISYIMETPLISLASIPFVIIGMVLIYLLWLQLLLPLFEIFTILLIYGLMIYFNINLPYYAIILITVAIRMLFKYFKFYFTTN